MIELATIDFETEGIEQKSYPPKPVGLAIARPGWPRQYFAWGHPEGNNCDESTAREVLAYTYRNYDVLMHNAPFDLHVARKHWGLWPSHKAHCSQILRFLCTPHAQSFGLKESAKELFGIAPDARDAVREWLIEHGYRKHVRSVKELGKFICKAPGDVVGPYACEDVRLPPMLFERFHAQIMADAPSDGLMGLQDAYQRELDMIKVCLDMTDRGVKIDCARLEFDVRIWQSNIDELARSIFAKLGCFEFELSKPAQLARAMERAGKITNWVLTETGKPSIGADNLKLSCNDPELVELLEVHGIINKCLNTFGLPWLENADNNGRVHPQWNSTRRGEGHTVGARTGRSRSSPNFQNLIKLKNGHPAMAHGALIPNLRAYVIPERGAVLLDRDYSQQEFRALAHFEDGPLLQAYLNNPSMDVHETGRLMMNDQHGLNLTEEDRTLVKIIGFGLIYGMGAGLLAETMGLPVAKSKAFKEAYLSIFPGITDLIKGLKGRALDGKPIRTIGGRTYYCEPDAVVDGRLRKFDYKLLNYLIQGSAADLTKAAMISAHRAGLALTITVHDQLIAEASYDHKHLVMHKLKHCMEKESIALDVELLSDGKMSEKNWAQMEKYDDNYREAESNNS